MEAGMRLKSIMNTAVEVIEPHASVATAERRLRRKGIHHLVVVDGDIIVGAHAAGLVGVAANRG
jgi:CBS domain-containing protein